MRARLLVLGLIALVLLASACTRVVRPADTGTLPGRAVPTLRSPHVPYVGAPHEAYNSVPPTSGPHVPQTTAAGVYRRAIPEEIQVHVLEHGHVLLQYAPGTSVEQITLLEGIARRHFRDVVAAPYDRLDAGIALTAWGLVERLDGVDEGRIERFVQAFAGRHVHGRRDL